MKRFLLFFLTVVLCCTLIVVPAFAHNDLVATSEYTEDNKFVFSGTIADGYYAISFGFVDDGLAIVESPGFGFADSVDFTFYNELNPVEQYRLVGGLTDDGSYEFGLYSLFEDGTYESMVPEESSSDYFLKFYLETYIPPEEPEAPSPTGVLEVFTSIGAWIGSALGTLSGVFWSSASNSLTFLGVLAVAGLALAVVLLIIFVVVRFLRFRG